jgi:hypothetical protein
VRVGSDGFAVDVERIGNVHRGRYAGQEQVDRVIAQETTGTNSGERVRWKGGAKKKGDLPASEPESILVGVASDRLDMLGHMPLGDEGFGRESSNMIFCDGPDVWNHDGIFWNVVTLDSM